MHNRANPMQNGAFSALYEDKANFWCHDAGLVWRQMCA